VKSNIVGGSFLKKTIGITLIFIIVIISLTGCGQNQTTNSSETSQPSSLIVDNNDSSIQKSSNVDSATSKIQSSTNSQVSENNQNSKTYFGNWVIKQKIPLPREIGNLTESEAQNIIGMELHIQENVFTSLDGKTLSTPKYNEITINDVTFYTEWKFHLKEVGINSNSVKEVMVYKTNPNDGYFDNVLGGGFFGIIDNNTLYVNIRGQFFKLERK
jgi:hypothetical protein